MNRPQLFAWTWFSARVGGSARIGLLPGAAGSPGVLPALGLAAVLSGCGTDWAGKDLSDVDADGDGYSVADGDCWDSPGAITIDGVTVGLEGADVNPGAEDAPYDGFDADCAGDEDFDADGDGFVPAAYLSATILNLPDFDIGSRPADADCADVEDDYDDRNLHQTVANADRPDPATVFPGAEVDAFYDGIDGDCEGGDDFDADGDGYDSADHEQIDGSIGADCDDTVDTVNPDAAEICDDIDNDCDTAVDGDDSDFDTTTLRSFYTDADGDGFGDPDTEELSCSALADKVEVGEDCDDTDINVNPDADEVCDDADRDEDCDGLADDSDDSTLDAGKTTLYADTDTDGYGNPGDALLACDAVDGYITDNSDCDDTDIAINPAATEVCDALDVDENCNGMADDADAGVDPGSQATFYADSDGDGYGDLASTNAQCDPGGGYIADATDCDDGASAINPGATEVCDAADTDEDCDSLSDDADSSLDASTQTTYYTDDDGDGFGDLSDAGTGFCEDDQPAGYVLDNTDCDDALTAVNPDATEICDADDTDEDCNGSADDADSGVDTSTQDRRYPDADSDGYGDETSSGTLYCDPPASVVEDNTDCDDAASGVNPGEDEVCDGADLDENCNGSADDADATILTSSQTRYYPDGDSDGYGDESDGGTLYCDAPSGVTTDNSDCDDVLSAINPGATEVCDGADTDEDCDGLADDDDPSTSAGSKTTYYEDTDGDGFGDAGAAVQVCDPAADEVADSTDCNDSLASVYPEAGETCNDGEDSDCDGSGTTETFSGVASTVCTLSAGVLETEALRTYDGGPLVGGLGEAFAIGDLDGAAEGAEELVIGAPGTGQFGISEMGAVYVVPSQFEDALPANDTLTVSIATARRFTGDEDDQWVGASVAVGDVDDDGYADLVVGAPGDARNGSGNNPKGSIYVVAGPITGTGDSVLSTVADYSGSTPNGLSFLGSDIIVGGDADNDLVEGDLLIGSSSCGGSFYGDETNEGSGKVYFLGAGSSPIPSILRHVTTPSITVDDHWLGTTCGGWAIAMGDFDNTGVETVFISEPEVGGIPFGRVYIDQVDGTGGQLSNADFIWGPGSGSFFGEAITVGDLDNDGYEDAIMSATFDGDGTGAVYILDGDETWSSSDYVHQISGIASITAASANTRFGASISLAGDVDGDGNEDLLIGEPDGSSGGGVWLMYGPFSGATTAAAATGDQWTSTEDSAGTAVLGGMNTDGDGYDSFVVGAPDDSTAFTDGGQAYLFSALGD